VLESALGATRASAPRVCPHVPGRGGAARVGDRERADPRWIASCSVHSWRLRVANKSFSGAAGWRSIVLVSWTLAGCPDDPPIGTDAGPLADGGHDSGLPDAETPPDGGDPDAGTDPDGGAPDGGGDPDAGTCGADQVDLLFTIDNSGSMTEEQASLAEQLPRLVGVLASGDRDPTIDADGDGASDDVGDDFAPVGDLHVGVVTTDLGVGPAMVPTCDAVGDDAVLATDSLPGVAGCDPTYPTFLAFGASDDPAEFARDASCLTTRGNGGCGFEQQLEATLKAITPSTCTDPWCTFDRGSRGHADGANAGFLRPDSLLALVILTDEEDCSAADIDVIDPASTRYSGELNLRCFYNPSALHPISRFVDGLLATRREPSDLVYAAIAGVPTYLTTSTSTYEEILAAPEMVEMLDPTMTNRLRPSCNVPGRGVAFPPRRLVEVARGLDARGASGIVESICQADFTPALDALIERVGERVVAGCE
jgi:hypothetical protein